MRRMFIATVAIGSALVAAVVLWMAPPTTLAVNNYLWRNATGKYVGLKFEAGHLALMASTRTSPFSFDDKPPGPASHRFVHQSGVSSADIVIPSNSLWNHLGFYSWPGNAMIVLANDEEVRYDEWWLPTWALIAALLMPGIGWVLLAARDRRRRSARICVVCGYDLRASPATCPECGTTVPSTPAAG